MDVLFYQVFNVHLINQVLYEKYNILDRPFSHYELYGVYGSKIK